MSNTTANQAPLIKSAIFSEFILEHINDGFLPEGIHRDVSDFGDGTTLYIPVLGETILRDYVEDTGIEFDAVDSGQVTLTITDYVSAASYVTDKLKQDAYKAAALEASIPKEHLRVIKERYETDLLANKQTVSVPGNINGFAHRWVAASGSTAGVITLEDFNYAKLSFDKANVPEEGRVLIADPIVEMSLNHSMAATVAVNNNPQFEGIITTGFAKGRRFLRNIAGFDIWLSNRLPRVTETIDGGPHGSSKSVTSGVVNQFMCLTDDQHKPYMGAWRQQPQAEGFRNVTFKRDEYSTTARWGFGKQRDETLICVLTSATAYK
ncbi:MAG: hypothetical protein RBS78_01000 [Coriobacteriia bacterium]|nr:hypothetical protein [Coriobacteriia bacterium]